MTSIGKYIYSLIIFISYAIADIYSSGRRSEKATEGQSLKIHCFIVERALNDLNYEDVEKMEWRKDGSVIAYYTKTPIKTETWVSDSRYFLDRSQFALIIDNLSVSDTGQYKCWPRFRVLPRTLREIHIHPDVVILTVLGVPSKPGKPYIQSYSSRNVLLSWIPSTSHADTPILRYIIKSITNHNISSSVEDISPGNGTNWLITGLLPLTVYRFEVAAENVVGRGPFSAVSYPIRTRGEAPDSPPRFLSVYNNTNTSLIITWDHPPASSLHGAQIAGYRLSVVSMESPDRKDFYISKPDYNTFEIPKLLPFTKYMITLEADNLFGFSPPATILVLTAEGVPASGPTITKTQVLSNSGVELTFLRPNVTRGIITHYTLYLRRLNDFSGSIHQVKRDEKKKISADTKIEMDVFSQRNTMQYQLQNLEPCTNYSVWITASTSRGESAASEVSIFITDTFAPSSPTIVNISLINDNYVYIEWLPPVQFCFRVDFYLINIVDEYLIRRQFNSTETYITLNNFQPFIRYTISVRAATGSLLYSNRQRYYVGSETTTILVLQVNNFPEISGPLLTLRTSVCPFGEAVTFPPWQVKSRNSDITSRTIFCDKSLLTFSVTMPTAENSTDRKESAHSEIRASKSGVPVVAVAVLGTFGLLIVLVLLIIVLAHFWRRYFGGKDCLAYAADTIESANARNTRNSEYNDESDCATIAAEDFVSYVNSMHADSDSGFARLYERIEHSCATSDRFSKLSCDHSVNGDNKLKNRYVNILSYDHSRVKLKSLPGIKNSDYINANFVDSFNQRRAYIATQGPLSNTVVDFWRMVWEYNCQVIVMITNIIERGRKKCEQYWPSKGEETYGSYIVTMREERIMAFYTVRTFALRCTNKKQMDDEPSRIIFQYHCNTWPDHGVPESTPAVLRFIEKSTAANCDPNAPIIVHCSAGVGRSGTYIVIDAMLRQMRVTGQLSVCGFLKRIRHQRMALVQTEEQYIFCHDAIMEAFLLGNTEIESRNFRQAVAKWLAEPHSSALRKQYDHIMSLRTFRCEEAERPYNAYKNRSCACVTSDAYRVVINACPGDAGSEYVNATFLPGFHQPDEFIVTQFPTNETRNQFWQMLWDRNCHIAVLLVKPDKQNFLEFWPNSELGEKVIECGYLSISSLAVLKPNDRWCCIELLIRSIQDDNQMTCQLICCLDWENVMKKPNEIWELIRTVHEIYVSHDDGPLVVVDSFGGRDAATLCLLNALRCQLDQEKCVDVYTLARCYHERRPGILPEFTDYLYLFECLEALITRSENCTTDSSGYDVLTGATEAKISEPPVFVKSITVSPLCNGHYPGLPKDTTL